MNKHLLNLNMSECPQNEHNANESMFGLRSNRGVKRSSGGSGHMHVDTPELIKKRL